MLPYWGSNVAYDFFIWCVYIVGLFVCTNRFKLAILIFWWQFGRCQAVIIVSAGYYSTTTLNWLTVHCTLLLLLVSSSKCSPQHKHGSSGYWLRFTSLKYQYRAIKALTNASMMQQQFNHVSACENIFSKKTRSQELLLQKKTSLKYPKIKTF